MSLLQNHKFSSSSLRLQNCHHCHIADYDDAIILLHPSLSSSSLSYCHIVLKISNIMVIHVLPYVTIKQGEYIYKLQLVSEVLILTLQQLPVILWRSVVASSSSPLRFSLLQLTELGIPIGLLTYHDSFSHDPTLEVFIYYIWHCILHCFQICPFVILLVISEDCS